MLIDFIQKLRKKPEESRALFVWVATGIIMLIIIVLWLNFGMRQDLSMGGSNQPKIDKISKKNIGKFGKFFNDAKNDFLYLKANLSQAMGDLFSGKSEPKEIPPELKQYLPQKPTNPTPPLKLPETE